MTFWLQVVILQYSSTFILNSTVWQTFCPGYNAEGYSGLSVDKYETLVNMLFN
jgi:hypothetical protein